MDLPTLFLGVGRETLTVAAGTIAGLVVAVVVAGVCWITLAPLYSREWAETFGVQDVASGGVDPAEAIDGRSDPVAPTTRDAAEDAPAVVQGESDATAGDVPGTEPSA